VAEPIITKVQAIARLGQTMFTRIFDDNNDSVADKLSEEQMRADASDRVRGKLGPVYNPDLLTQATAATVGELRRLVLDNFVAMCAERRPTIVKRDADTLFKRADADLKDLRIQLANLGTNSPPEPAENVGGEVYADDGGDEPQRFFTGCGGTGIF